jgi:deazaflavin-dependent oxidoreductase (nitroreductase family)
MKYFARAHIAVYRRTNGKLGAKLLWFPAALLTTTGRKSGLRRTSHLIAVPYEDTLALLGTNFGQPSTPAWVLNLEAEPRASVAHEATSIEVVARPATETERSQVLARAATVYGGYAKYLGRISGRQVRIFVLEPASSPP